MSPNRKLIGVMALAAVGVSLAQAQGYGYGFAYVSASYYASAPGLYYTATSGQYVTTYSSQVGTNWSSYNFNYGGTYNGPQYSEAIGWSRSSEQPGGAGAYEELIDQDNVTITNLGQNADTLFVDVYTVGFGSAFAGSWQDYAYGGGEAALSDSDGQMEQFSYGESQDQGLGEGGNSYQWMNYSYSASSGFSYSSGYQFFGNSFPFATYGLADYSGVYAITLQPGWSDTFYADSIDVHDAYSITPGPVAAAPFFLGLIGVLRRRQKN